MSIEKEVQGFGSEAEESYGFAQAVRVADTIYVSGQTAYSDAGHVVGEGDMAAQMREAYAKIEALLGKYGAGMQNVVEETLFVTDMPAAIEAARKVRGEAYAEHFELASTLIGVQALGAPQIMIEIRCTARA